MSPLSMPASLGPSGSVDPVFEPASAWASGSVDPLLMPSSEWASEAGQRDRATKPQNTERRESGRNELKAYILNFTQIISQGITQNKELRKLRKATLLLKQGKSGDCPGKEAPI